MHFLWDLKPNPQAGMNRRSFNWVCGSTSKNLEVFVTYVNCIQKNTYPGMHSLDSMFQMISECDFHRDFSSKLNSRDLSRGRPQQASYPMVIWKPVSSLIFQSLKCKGSPSLLGHFCSPWCHKTSLCLPFQSSTQWKTQILLHSLPPTLIQRKFLRRGSKCSNFLRFKRERAVITQKDD